MLKDIIFLERELESAKIELTLKPDFNLLDAFRMVDVRNTGWVTFQELSEFLSRIFDLDTMSVLGMETLQLFFARYDTNKDGKISLAEFCAALTPKVGKEYSSLVQGRAEFYSKKGFEPQDYFNPETRRVIKQLWQNLFFTERQLENLRNRIIKGPLFSL
jgi:EF-hand domain pair